MIDASTEIYTDNGWKTYKTITKKDKTVSLHRDEGCEWRKIISIVVRRPAEFVMHRITSDSVDQYVTQHHRVLEYDRTTGYTHTSTRNITGHVRIPTTATNINPDAPVTTEELDALAFIGELPQNPHNLSKTQVDHYLKTMVTNNTVYGKKEFLNALQPVLHTNGYTTVMTTDTTLVILKQPSTSTVSEPEQARVQTWSIHNGGTNYMIRRNGKISFTGI